MSSRFRLPEPVFFLTAAAVLAVGGAAAQDNAPASQSLPLSVAVTTLFPGGGAPPAPDPHVKIYEGNAKHIAEGKRLFDWYNCAGCHFHGAGGIGPAFMDPDWSYGDRLDQIFDSIYQGRPNGMPSWAGKIPDEQIWEIAAYVKSLSTSPAALAPAPTEPPHIGEPLPASASNAPTPPQ